VAVDDHAAVLLRLARRADYESKRLKREAITQVLEAHDAGASWTDVGNAFGITRQAAYERFHGVNRPGRPRRPR
jgi:hypothetical protein